MGRASMGLALGAWTAVYIVTAALAGAMVDRLGIKVALTLGGLSLAATGIARSVAQGPVSLWLAIAIMGIGGPLVSAAAPTLCAQWFMDPDERRFALTIYNLGPGLGSIVTIFATNAVLLPWLGDWRRVLAFEASVALGLTLLWVLIAWRAPIRSGISSARRSTPLLEEWRTLLQSPDLRLALVLGALTFFVSHSLGNWLVDALSIGADVGAQVSANWVAVAGGLGLLLLFVVPRFVAKFGRANVLTAGWLFIIVGMLLVGFGPPPLALVGALSSGARTVMVPLLIMSVMSAQGVNETNMGAANGLWFSSAQIGAVCGPFLVGVIADSRAGFGGAMAMLSIIGALTLWLIRSRPDAKSVA